MTALGQILRCRGSGRSRDDDDHFYDLNIVIPYRCLACHEPPSANPQVSKAPSSAALVTIELLGCCVQCGEAGIIVSVGHTRDDWSLVANHTNPGHLVDGKCRCLAQTWRSQPVEINSENTR